MVIFAAGLAGGAVAGGFCGIATEVAIGTARSTSGSALTFDACANGGSAPSVKKIVMLRMMQILMYVPHEQEQNTELTHLSQSLFTSLLASKVECEDCMIPASDNDRDDMSMGLADLWT